MAELVFSNNADATLAFDISANQTTVELAPGKGALFPSPTGGQVTKVTIQSLATFAFEIVDCVGRNVDVLTVVRGTEGTTPKSFSAATARVQGRITAGVLQSFFQSGGVSQAVQTYFQPSQPIAPTIGSLWIDTDSSPANLMYRWSGAAWELVENASIAASAAAILTEQTVRADGDTALSSQITTVSAVAASKNKAFRQTEPPTGTFVVNDAWYDTNDSNRLYLWNGTQWSEFSDSRIAQNAAAIVTEQTARADGDTALASSITTVSATANSKNRTFHQTTAPTALAVGDIWVDSDSSPANQIFRWDGSSWVAADNAAIATNTAAITTEASVRAAADGTINARYGVKVNVNGKVSGFGLISEANDGAIVSTFDVLADNFKISNSSGGVLQTPFEVVGSVVKMRNVVIGTAVIEDASITSLKVAGSAITTDKLAAGAATGITVGFEAGPISFSNIG